MLSLAQFLEDIAASEKLNQIPGGHLLVFYPVQFRTCYLLTLWDAFVLSGITPVWEQGTDKGMACPLA